MSEVEKLSSKKSLIIKIVYYSAFFLFFFLADLITKLVLEANLVPGESHNLGPFVVRLTFNPGMAFGIGATTNGEPNWASWLLMSLSLIMSVVGIVYFVKFFKKNTKTFNFLILLCITGAFGNLIDRFFFCIQANTPYVRGVIDWIEFSFVNFATFNLADSYLVVGVIALAIYLVVKAIISYVQKKQSGEVDVTRTNRVLSKDEIDQLKMKEQEEKERTETHTNE